MGFVVALSAMIGVVWFVRKRRPRLVVRVARRLQLVSACAMAFSHGSNDAQKVMGVITLSLVSYVTSGEQPVLPAFFAPVRHGKNFDVPSWVMFACALAIALGTTAGGKRIIKTMGSKIIKISPLQGVVSDTAGTATILTASFLGVPVSTTHCVNACIMGVGASRRVSSVRWGVARRILVAWVVTLPASALFAAITFSIMTCAGMNR
jgi:PiT family inorganic phosphate transporter